MKPTVDYSLYLVTDSTDAILGVTVVQYRDKTSDTGDLIRTAHKLHQVCKRHGIPLIINDRVDVALAVDCEGVHIGQDDMDLPTARRLLGPDKIIGVTVCSIEEARVAVEQGADNLGIGTLYSTATKKNTKSIIGINGIRKILHWLSRQNDRKYRDINTVCIGGINASNVQRVLYQLHAPSSEQYTKTVDGIAIVSAIMAAEQPDVAAKHFKQLLTMPSPWKAKSHTISIDAWNRQKEEEKLHDLKEQIPKIVGSVYEKKPLSHNMTNLVVQNFAANVALAIGASPIMSNNGAEAPDLAKLNGGLVINMGTATPEILRNHCLAIAAYNAAGNPIVLDPVGAGATSARREALATLMAAGYFDLIKGNEREILAVAAASGLLVNLDDKTQQRGVDSGDSLLTNEQKTHLVSRIAARERNTVLMTGKDDFISDGHRTFMISNGHQYLGMITGSGCVLGTTLAAYMAAAPEDKLVAAVVGILHFELAAQRACEIGKVDGPGTFVPAFIDALSFMAINKGRDIVQGLKVRVLGGGEGDGGFVREM
ncbi:TMP-TENI-domain-containing protein [Delitschia confertaspora ATCC 74209]|uniref:TMP-TENI-domain-containing protein n=1 Tax=Delitschia confertaspora ATCC 74209 TaxID=1513339 RepID=A0A9P4JP59_9PLEO|nr:TMP-TENI-domain-containing protein [Delitschia confertaspora ATCC 74209]